MSPISAQWGRTGLPLPKNCFPTKFGKKLKFRITYKATINKPKVLKTFTVSIWWPIYLFQILENGHIYSTCQKFEKPLWSEIIYRQRNVTWKLDQQYYCHLVFLWCKILSRKLRIYFVTCMFLINIYWLKMSLFYEC